MSIVKISQELHDAVRTRAKAMSRSINMQAEYWIKIGKLAEENPNLTYREIWQQLVDAADREDRHAH